MNGFVLTLSIAHGVECSARFSTVVARKHKIALIHDLAISD